MPNPNSIPTQLNDLDAEDRFAVVLFVVLVVYLILALGIQIKAVPQSESKKSALEVSIERPMPAVNDVSVPTSELVVEEAVEPESVEPMPEQKQEEVLPEKPDSVVVEPTNSLLPVIEIPLLEDPTWYSSKQLDEHPVALHPVDPVYPEKVADQGVEGTVVLLLLIDEFGVVREVSVADSKPEGVFDESALTVFREARFAPAQKNGRAVKSRVLIRVSYELTKRGQPLAMPPRSGD